MCGRAYGKCRMKRRQLFCNTAAIIGAAGLARPRIARAASASTLKFVPYADLALLDPLVSAFVTRNHVMMVFDTLFALDANGDARPQMLAGHTVDNGAKTWRLTLRDGLLYHDGSKVLARDVVASLRRGWSNRRWIWCRHWADCGLIRRHEVSLMCGRLRPTYWRKRSPACSIPSALSQLSSDPDGVTRARQPMDQYLRLRTKGPGQSIWSIQQRSYVPNFHGDTGSTFTARSAVSDSRSFSSRRKESYSAI